MMITRNRYRRAENEKNPENNIEISHSLKDNLTILQEQFKDCADVVMRSLKTAGGRSACMIYVNGLIDNNLVQRDVIPTLLSLKESQLSELKDTDIFPTIQYSKVFILETAVDYVLKASTVILINGINYALCFNLQDIETRAFDEPEVERIIKGPHDGFVESVAKNLSLIRRKVASSKLKVKMMTLGKRSKSDIAILYMEDIANPEIVRKVEERIKNIEIDNINGAGYIDQLTSDSPFSLFPQFQGTERADKAVANLMEGRIVILVGNTPVALIVPVDFFQFFQTPDDYNINYFFGSFLRLLRFTGSAIAILLPALYIALLTFHYQAVPLNLLVPLAESRSKIPFSPIVEAMIMEIAFELLREASIRLPTSLGPTIGIVGGLVIGQTAVQAGIVSNVMVVIVGITAIATFVVPQYDMGLVFRIGRFITMISAAIFGAVGIMVVILFAIAHLVTLESYGQPYFQPVAPFKLKDMKDIFFRLPLFMYSSRPDVALPNDKTRGRGNSKRR
jgi:spore germination protein